MFGGFSFQRSLQSSLSSKEEEEDEGEGFTLFIGGEPLRREGQVRLQRHLGTLHAFQLHDRRLWGC